MPTSKGRIAVATGPAATVAVSALIVAIAPSRATPRGPNGLIVFSQQAGEHRQLFTIRPDRTELTQVTRLQGDASDPAWPPDGERVTFGADLGDRAAVSTIRFDGTDLRGLTPCGFQGQPTRRSCSRRASELAARRDQFRALATTLAPLRRIDPGQR
jgi:hypothetical protein